MRIIAGIGIATGTAAVAAAVTYFATLFLEAGPQLLAGFDDAIRNGLIATPVTFILCLVILLRRRRKL